jgi:hypothetical protein
MPDLLPIALAGLVGFAANYGLERFRRRGALNEARRKAYASWFTSEEVMYVRVKGVCERLVGFPKNHEKYESLVAEVRSLTDEIRSLVTAMNDAFLAERSWRVRKKLSSLNEILVSVLDTLDFAARHYTENLWFHEQFEKMTDDSIKGLPDEERALWSTAKKQFEQHDAECPFKSEAFRTRLSRTLERVHDQAGSLREVLARKLSQ